MTYVEMVKAIAEASGLPRSVVRHVLDTQIEVLKRKLVLQDEIAFRGLFKIRSDLQDRVVRSRGEPKSVQKLILSVKPVPSFRKELNKWTSTES